MERFWVPYDELLAAVLDGRLSERRWCSRC